MLKQFLAGAVGSVELTQKFLLGASVLMEIPILVVLLARVLEYRFNRCANIVAGGVITGV